MIDRQKLYDGIGNAAWGYLFIYFNVNLGTLNILPAFVGYLLFHSAIKKLCDAERELNLLNTLVGILTIWHIASWIGDLLSFDLGALIPIADIIVSVVNIYFHFQLMTNLATIAAKYQLAGEDLDRTILNCRTFQTIMLTAAILLVYMTNQINAVSIYTSIAVAILYLIAGIILMHTLFGLRKCFVTEEEGKAEEKTE
jgi:hypothetical protein